MKSIKDHWLIHHLLFHFTLPANPLICLKSQQYFFFSKSCLFFLKSHLLQGHFQYRNSIEGKAAYTKIPPLSAPRNNQMFLLFLSIHFVEIDCLVVFFLPSKPALFILTMEISNFIMTIGFYFGKSDTTEPQKAWLRFSKIKCFNQSWCPWMEVASQLLWWNPMMYCRLNASIHSKATSLSCHTFHHWQKICIN